MRKAIILGTGFSPQNEEELEDAKNRLYRFLQENPLGVKRLSSTSSYMIRVELQQNPTATTKQILEGSEKIQVFPNGIAILHPNSAANRLNIGPLEDSIGLIITFKFQDDMTAVVGAHFDQLALQYSNPSASREARDWAKYKWKKSILEQIRVHNRDDIGSLTPEELPPIFKALSDLGFALQDGTVKSLEIQVLAPASEDKERIEWYLRHWVIFPLKSNFPSAALSVRIDPYDTPIVMTVTTSGSVTLQGVESF